MSHGIASAIHGEDRIAATAVSCEGEICLQRPIVDWPDALARTNTVFRVNAEYRGGGGSDISKK